MWIHLTDTVSRRQLFFEENGVLHTGKRCWLMKAIPIDEDVLDITHTVVLTERVLEEYKLPHANADETHMDYYWKTTYLDGREIEGMLEPRHGNGEAWTFETYVDKLVRDGWKIILATTPPEENDTFNKKL
jgi:RES domain-containing protein